ncbi:MAG: macro domain-containing protein [Candidatus Lokiarchaeota archaeon]|nr:macro domain-containing protein [Candidatus Harpocratesius repetitus]
MNSNNYQIILENYPHKPKIELVLGDITNQKLDVIVNAANEQLLLGAGVAGAIRRKGGSQIQEECKNIGYTPVGEVAVTSAGELKDVKYIFHAVGPKYHSYSPNEADILLRDTISNSLKKLIELNLSSIAFPAISTGIFGFPLKRAAKNIIMEILDYLTNSPKQIHVCICLFKEEDYSIFYQVLQDKLVEN